VKSQSVVIVNSDIEVAKKVLQLLSKLGFRATENYDTVEDTKIIVFSK
jgi:hypothetical protein